MLLARIRRAMTPSATDDGAERLVPLAAVDDVLREHDLFLHSDMTLRELHERLLKVRTAMAEDGKTEEGKTEEGKTEEGKTEEGKTERRGGCVACGGHALLLDERTGSVVCKACGCVIRSQLNVQRSYEEPVMELDVNELSVAGVSRARLVGSLHQTVVPDASAEVRHWNDGYAHLPRDELPRVMHVLATWKSGDSAERRAIVAILYVLLERRLPTGAEVRERLERGGSMAPVTFAPNPHECAECGRKFGDRKSARHCCGTSWAVPRKRSRH